MSCTPSLKLSSSSLLCLLLMLLLRCRVFHRPSSCQALYFVAANSCGTAKKNMCGPLLTLLPLPSRIMSMPVSQHHPSSSQALYFVVANEYIVCITQSLKLSSSLLSRRQQSASLCVSFAVIFSRRNLFLKALIPHG